MLKYWHVENFKAIVDSGDLKLAPVTVLAGLNSSGKSSLLQSILMLSQTLRDNSSEEALVTNGSIVQLGSFSEVKSFYSISDSIIISFAIDIEKINVEFIDEAEMPYKYEWITQLHTEIRVEFTSDKFDSSEQSILDTAKIIAKNIYLKVHIKEPEIEDAWQISLRKVNANDIRQSAKGLNIAFPFIEKNQLFVDDNQETEEKAVDEPFKKLFASVNHFVLSSVSKVGVYEDAVGAKVGLDEDFIPFSVSYTPEYEIGQTDIENFFKRNIRYLGPLRLEPQSFQHYPASRELGDVGSRGEFAAAIYDNQKNTKINWYNPNTNEVVNSSLQDALNSWVRYLKVADEVMVKLEGHSGYNWQVRQAIGYKPVSLAAVGVGVSQILPILVTGLLSPKDSLLIIEQPELHLHPRVQSLLGDFFTGLAKCGKQCLIETHSENLVNQLRLHIVKAGGIDKSDCLIYFAHQEPDKGAVFEPIEISPRGNILNWPEGFFDVTIQQEEEILFESLKRRANKNA